MGLDRREFIKLVGYGAISSMVSSGVLECGSAFAGFVNSESDKSKLMKKISYVMNFQIQENLNNSNRNRYGIVDLDTLYRLPVCGNKDFILNSGSISKKELFSYIGDTKLNLWKFAPFHYFLTSNPNLWVSSINFNNVFSHIKSDLERIIFKEYGSKKLSDLGFKLVDVSQNLSILLKKESQERNHMSIRPNVRLFVLMNYNNLPLPSGSIFDYEVKGKEIFLNEIDDRTKYCLINFEVITPIKGKEKRFKNMFLIPELSNKFIDLPNSKYVIPLFPGKNSVRFIPYLLSGIGNNEDYKRAIPPSLRVSKRDFLKFDFDGCL